MKLTIVIWDTLYPTISSLARTSEFDTKVYSERELDTDRERLELLKEDLKASDVIVAHRTTHQFWDEIVPFISDLDDKRIICFGQDPSYWGLSTVDPAIVSKVYAYEQSGDHDNLENMFRFIENTFIDDTITYYNRYFSPEEVVARALSDMKKGKDVSVCGFSVRVQVLLTKLLPHKLIMYIWCKQQKK